MTSAVIDAGDGLPLTIPAWARRQANTFSDQLLLCGDEQLSYREADDRSRRLARALIAAGVRKGSHVGLLYPNGAEFIVAMLAVARIGAVVLPFSTLSTAAELRWLLANADAEFLLAAPGFRSRDYVELLRAAIPDLDLASPAELRSPAAPWLRRIWFGGAPPAGVDPSWTRAALETLATGVDEAFLESTEARVVAADRLVIVHTSGSTGAPKGVIHTHGALIRTLRNINEIRSVGPDAVLYATTPWFWIAGFAWSLLQTFLAGGRVIATDAVAPSDILDVLDRERPNITLGYGRSVAPLAADPSFAGRDLSSIRRGMLYPILARDVQPKDPSLRHEVYGMTEVGGAFSLTGDETDQPESRRGACGLPLPGFEGRIVDPETGRDCETGELGELWIRGAFMMQGYYGRSHSEVFQSDGWWRSGDVGAFDADGFFYLKGRLGDMIKTAGANVSPREVEAVLSEAAGGRHVIVLGVPDEDRGQAVAGVVITDAPVDEVALRQRVATTLSSYKVPRRIIGLTQPEIPLLASGKVDMRTLAGLVNERTAGR